MNKKDFGFSKKIKTNICQEVPTENNPYLAKKRLISGYDIEDLSQQCSLIDSIYLLFKGELPNEINSEVLNVLFIGLINLGPRHPATRAAMTAGISKANAEHILPIGLMALGGNKGGAAEVALAYAFISENMDKEPVLVANEKLALHLDKHQHIAAGFGSSYGAIDTILSRIFLQLLQLKPESKVFQWCNQFVDVISIQNCGWLNSGLAAAVFLELGFKKRESVGLFQLACAPGVLAHGVEQTHRPITDMPLLEDENYVLKK